MLYFLAGGWVLCAFVGWAIGAEKGRALDGFFWGLIFGVVGIIIAAVMKPASYFEDTRTCPHCAEQVKPEALVCKHCGRDLAPAGDATT